NVSQPLTPSLLKWQVLFEELGVNGVHYRVFYLRVIGVGHHVYGGESIGVVQHLLEEVRILTYRTHWLGNSDISEPLGPSHQGLDADRHELHVDERLCSAMADIAVHTKTSLQESRVVYGAVGTAPTSHVSNCEIHVIFYNRV